MLALLPLKPVVWQPDFLGLVTLNSSPDTENEPPLVSEEPSLDGDGTDNGVENEDLVVSKIGLVVDVVVKVVGGRPRM